MTTINKAAFFEKIGYKPHSEGQVSFHASRARFRIPVCGRRYGKSTMAGRDLEPELFKREPRYYWIVAPTYDLGEKEFRVIWNDLIVGQKLGRDKRVRKAYNKRSGDMYIEFPWGVRLEVRSASHPETLVGEGLSGAIMSEAAKHTRETWERFIRPALADKRGWATFPTTPEGHNWLYSLWLLGQNEAYPDFESWRFPSWENRVVFPGGREDEEIKLIESTTEPEWFGQEYGADFASFVGRIYPEFDELTHVRKHTFNPAWKNYIFLDWGYVDPFVAIDVQIDPQDNVYIWRERYGSYTRLEDHLALMKSRAQPVGYHINACYGDAADPEAVATVSTKFAPCIAMPEAKVNWRQGISRVRGFTQLHAVGEEDEYGTPKEVPKLFVDPSCTNAIREFVNYRGKEGTPVRSPGDVAVGVDDHIMDALRYGLVHIYDLGANTHLADLWTPTNAQEPEQVLAGSLAGLITSDEGGIFTMDRSF